MTIVERVQQAIEEVQREKVNDPTLKSLGEFYAEMKRLGIAQKQEYSLPPLDTVGRELHERMQSRVKRTF